MNFLHICNCSVGVGHFKQWFWRVYFNHLSKPILDVKKHVGKVMFLKHNNILHSYWLNTIQRYDPIEKYTIINLPLLFWMNGNMIRKYIEASLNWKNDRILGNVINLENLFRIGCMRSMIEICTTYHWLYHSLYLIKYIFMDV